MNYNTYDLEFYAIICALKHWSSYLAYHEFVLYSDHDTLKHINSQDKLSSRHAVWAILTKDRFPVGEYNKLAARKIGHLEILEKINPNAYRLKLPSHMRTSDVFNVKALFGFFFSSLITPHSIFVTHYSSLKISHSVWHHHSLVITQYFSTVCEPHTCHLVRVKLFCGPHHFLFSHFPSFTPVTLPKHKPEPNFNHNNKNSDNDNNSSSNNNNNKTNPNPTSTTITTTTKCGQSDG